MISRSFFHFIDRFCYNLSAVAVLCVVSELAGPQQNIQRAGGGRERDPAAQTQVLLLRPERGLQGPGPAKSALCAGLTRPSEAVSLEGFMPPAKSEMFA